jgi:hypothetical protein
MEKCQAAKLLYNNNTKRCYKPCEQKNKVTHPVTKKCRQKCKTHKVRRVVDFRCVTQKNNNNKNNKKEDNNNEELIPPPLAKDIVKNFQFINDLVKKGKNKRVDYNVSATVSDIITVYFHEKYSQHCPMYPIKVYTVKEGKFFDTDYNNNKEKMTKEKFYEYRLKQNKGKYIDWNKAKFLKNLKLCLETGEQIITVPLHLQGHLNMLIIKAKTREIIRFEPHAVINKAVIYIHANTFLEHLTEDINVYLNLKPNKRFTYNDPSQICPRLEQPGKLKFYEGFQSMEEKVMEKGENEGAGFCQLWGWFFAECVINNPELPVKEVYAEAYNALKKENAVNFALVIRGYFFSINQELKKMKKKMSINNEYISTLKNNDVLLAYLNENQKKLKDKPRKPFVGGLNANNDNDNANDNDKIKNIINKKFVLPTGAGPYKPNWYK